MSIKTVKDLIPKRNHPILPHLPPCHATNTAPSPDFRTQPLSSVSPNRYSYWGEWPWECIPRETVSHSIKALGEGNYPPTRNKMSFLQKRNKWARFSSSHRPCPELGAHQEQVTEVSSTNHLPGVNGPGGRPGTWVPLPVVVWAEPPSWLPVRLSSQSQQPKGKPLSPQIHPDSFLRINILSIQFLLRTFSTLSWFKKFCPALPFELQAQTALPSVSGLVLIPVSPWSPFLVSSLTILTCTSSLGSCFSLLLLSMQNPWCLFASTLFSSGWLPRPLQLLFPQIVHLTHPQTPGLPFHWGTMIPFGSEIRLTALDVPPAGLRSYSQHIFSWWESLFKTN